MSKFSALDIANFYVQLANSIPDDSIDNLKLNKIVYFAQGRSLAVSGLPLFSDAIEAWEYGPVVPSVYRTFKCCGKNPIEEPETSFDESRLSAEELSVLVDVYTFYGKYSGIALKEMTHRKGTPWALKYEKGKNIEIPVDLIREYFKADSSFVGFTIESINAPVITQVPEDWDRAEDSVYD